MELPFQIIFAVIIVIFLVTTLMYLINLYRETESRNKVFSSFNNLKNKIETLCFSFPYTQDSEILIINEDLIAIFAYPESVTKIDNIDTLSNKILEGNFLCIAYKNERIKCEKLSCNITMKTYYYKRKTEILDFFVKSLYGIKEFELSLNLFRNFSKINIH